MGGSFVCKLWNAFTERDDEYYEKSGQRFLIEANQFAGTALVIFCAQPGVGEQARPTATKSKSPRS